MDSQDPGTSDPVRNLERSTGDPIVGRPATHVYPEMRTIGQAALRTLALVAIAVLLVLVVLPVALGAAGTQVASGP
jgi:hypothetical protein